MSASSSRSECLDVIDFFKAILRIQAKPIHFRELSIHYLLFCSKTKSFFHSFKDSEKFAFFRDQFKIFRINGNGFVTCIEDDVIEAFTELLKNSAASQHFLKVINATEVATIYFKQSPVSEQFKFFKDHSQVFSIKNSGNVKLKKERVINRVTWFDENEVELLLFFKARLASCGPTYFTWLLDYLLLENSLHHRNVVAMETDMKQSLWEFFKSHPSDFAISDNGFVDLSSHLKSTLKVHAFILEKEDEVIGFFIASLAFFGCVLFPLLLKLLQESTLDIRCFFATYSLSQIQGFFTKHSNTFISQGKYIALQHTVFCDEFIHFEGNRYPIKEQQEVTFFFLDNLATECPKHYIHLSQVLEESNIETGFKRAFVGCSASVKHCFFKSNPELFCSEGSGYVSLHSLVKLSDVGKRALLHFAKKLKISSVEHFFTLITSAEVSCTEFQNYFASFSPLYKFYFFKKFPTVFSVDVNGYVSCKVVPNLFPEAEVINMLIKKLELSQPIHFEKLCLSIENNSEVAMEFFQTYSVSQKYKFLKSKPMHFCLKSDGYVCLPVSSSALKDSVPGNISKSNHTSTDIAHDSTHVVSKTNGVQCSPTTSCSDCTTGRGLYTSEHICAYKLSSREGNAQCNPFVSLSDSLPISIANTIKYVCSEADDSQHRPSISHGDSSPPSITNNFEYVASETNVEQHSSADSCTDSPSVSTADTSKHASSKADDVQYSPILHQFSHSDSASVSIIAIPEHVSCETNVKQHSSAASCTDSSSVSTADTSERVSSKAAAVQYSPTSSNNSDSASVNITALPECVSSEISGVQYSPAASDSDSSPVCIANAHVSSGVSDAQSDSIALISSSSPLNSEDIFMHVTAETIAIEHNSTVSCSDNLPIKATTTVTPISSNKNDASCSSAVPYNAMAIYNTDRNSKSNMLISNTESSNENSDLNECFALDSQDILKNDVDFTFSESMSHTNEQHPAHKLLNEGKSESKEASENNPEVQIETYIPNSFEMLHNISNSVKTSPVLTRPSCELRSDAEKLEGTPKIDQVIKSLIDKLKTHKRIHFEKLCSSNEVSNYFLLYSVKEKLKFFKNHKEYFFVGMDAYVSIPEHTQNTGSIPLLPSNHLGLHENTSQSMLVSSSENTMNREQNTSISPSTNVCITEKPLTPCASHNSLETSNVHSALKNNSLLSQSHVSGFNNPSIVKQSSTKDDERVIILLKHHLNIYKRMHCLELCKLAKKHFKTHSDSEKFRFFKDRPQHFCIDNDSYVTFPSDTAAQCKSNIPVKSLKAVVAGNPSEVGKKRGKKKKQREIIAKLVSVLEEKKKLHFTILCSSDETITNYFKTFTIQQKLAFFKSRPQHFFICSERGHVSLPCDNQTSKSHTGVANLNFAGDVSKSKLTVLPGKMPTDRQKSLKLGSSDDSGNYVTFPSDTAAQCKINIPGKNLKAVVAGSASEVGKKKKKPAEIISKLMSVLEEKKKVHFTKLCSSDKTIENYFKIFTIEQKLQFFKSRSQYFFICPKGGYVSLPCDNQTSKSHIGVVNLNFAGDVSEPKLAVLPGKIPTDWRKSLELGNIYNSNSSSKVHERCSTTKTGVSDIGGHADQDSIDTSRSSVSNVVSSIEEANVIEVLTCYLKLCNRMHYLELFACVEKLNRDFFIPKFPFEKLAFLKRYPNHFHVGADNYVSLPKFADYSFNITPDVNAASPVSFKYQCISENEVLNVPVHDQILSSNVTNDYLSHGANQSTQAITIAPSQNELKEKSTLAGESKHVRNSKSDNPDVIVNAATQSKISRSHNPEASNSIVTDDDRVTLVPHRTHEAEPGIFVDNPKIDIKNAVKQIYKSDTNCGRRCNALRLKMSETESELQCNRSDFDFDHQEEMIRTLVSQLKTCKRVHFLKLYESCENINQTFKRVFYFFANYEKLEFLKSHPQCFVVDDAGFVMAPVVGRTSSSTSILGKEALESRYSSPYNSTDRQAESIGDPEDSGGESYLSSGTEEGFNNALQTNSAAEIAENDEVSLANIFQYDTFRLLMGHRREIIKTFVDRLKIGRCMHFTKLCKSAEKRNGTVKKFFYSFLDIEKLEFLKSCPQHFSVDSNGFVTLSPMTKSKVSTFVPCEESSKSISSNLHENEDKHSRLATSHNDANTVSRCITSNNEQSIDPSFKCNSEEERSLNALTSVASVTEKVTLEDLDTKGLLNFFQSILRAAGSLHYEEIFIKLEDSRVFRNYRTLFEQSGKLKFFEDHPDIFTIQSGGFISLIAEADPKSCPIKDVYKKTTWKEIGVITDNEKSKSCDYTCAHEKLSLSHCHMYIIRYFIKALQENQPLHFKQLVKDACIANHNVKFFFALFKTSAHLLDFCKLHSMYFIINDEEMVSLRRSNIMLDEVFSLDMELREIKSSIISKALEFYTTLLKSSDNLSIKEAESELQFAPGYVISFINTNYPGSKIIYFFMDHPHHFLLDDEGKIMLRTNETDTKNLLENTVIANDVTKNNDMPLKPENRYPSKVKMDYKFHPSIQDHSAVSLRLPENHEVPLKVHNSGNLFNVPDGNEASSSVLNENNDHLKEHADLSTISRLPLQSVPLSLSKFARSSSLVNPDQQQKCAHKPKFQGETIGKQCAKRNKVKQQLLDVRQLRTEIQPSNAIKQSTRLVTLPIAMRCKSDTVHHSLPSNIIDHNNADAQRMKLVDQDVQNAVDAESQFPPLSPVREALKQLATIAKSFNPEFEMKCVDFFESVMREKAHRVLHVKFLRAIASKSPDAIRSYLLQYGKEDFPLFFYLHLEHFSINSLGYVALRMVPNRTGCDNELEVKASNFFTPLIHFTFKGRASCDVLERSLHFASEEVKLYLSKTYKTNLKLFFCNHADHFDIDVFDNVSLKH